MGYDQVGSEEGESDTGSRGRVTEVVTHQQGRGTEEGNRSLEDCTCVCVREYPL